jgi:N-acetylmuramoyl-L-alanine amidase
MLIKRLATDRPDAPDGVLQARRKWMTQALAMSAGTVVLTLAGPQIAFGAGIVAVRVWPAEDYTRVTIESDTKLVAVHQMVRNPDRLVVDIEGLDLSPTLRELVAKISPNDPYIQSVRVGQNRPNVVRLVLDLKESVAPQVFTLGPIGSYRDRLVFDLYPVNAADPLWKLVRDTEDKQRRFASTPPPAGAEGVAGAPPTGEEDAIGSLVRKFEAQGDLPPLSAPTVPPAAPPMASIKPKPQAPATAAAPPSAPPVPPPVAQANPQERPFKMRRLLTVAIDPGHGGEDPGAIGGSGTYEKHVVLDIAKKLRAKIDAQPNMRAMMTRDADFFVPLNVRVQKARRVRPTCSCRSMPMRSSSPRHAALPCLRCRSAARRARRRAGSPTRKTRPTSSAAPTWAADAAWRACCSTCRPRRRSTTACRYGKASC